MTSTTGSRWPWRSQTPRSPGEFNVWSDPEAAHIVLTSGLTAEWVGLDVTEQVRLDPDTARRMAAGDEPFLAFAGRYTEAWIEHGRTEGLDGRSCALHDPLAVAAVAHPGLLTWRDAHVAVETGDTLRGVVIADFLQAPGTGLTPNARVAVDVDAAAFTGLFLDLLGGR